MCPSRGVVQLTGEEEKKILVRVVYSGLPGGPGQALHGLAPAATGPLYEGLESCLVQLEMALDLSQG